MESVQTKISGMLFTVEYKTQTELWKKLAQLEEVFGEKVCGKCGGTELRHIVRENKDGDEFFELICQGFDEGKRCRAKLAYGQHKKGETLFPSRKDKEGKYLDNGGWTVYVKPQE